MLEKLKQSVYEANIALVKAGLVTLTWGNVSGIDRENGVVVIKPSGVDYERLTPEDMVVVDMDGKVTGGTLLPSTDTPTHIALYKAFENIGGVCHTHSRWAVVFAQAGRALPPFGTTHADYFYGGVPVAGPLKDEEIAGDYEYNTGLCIARVFEDLDPLAVPAALVHGHAPFIWGKDAKDAVNNAVVLEETAFMAYHTLMLNPEARPVSHALLTKHYTRKHGAGAYYGQK